MMSGAKKEIVRLIRLIDGGIRVEGFLSDDVRFVDYSCCKPVRSFEKICPGMELGVSLSGEPFIPEVVQILNQAGTRACLCSPD